MVRRYHVKKGCCWIFVIFSKMSLPEAVPTRTARERLKQNKRKYTTDEVQIDGYDFQ